MAKIRKPKAGEGSDMPDFGKYVPGGYGGPGQPKGPDGRIDISREPQNKAWAKYMQDIHGWQPSSTYTSILNYGMSQINDFYRDDVKTVERQFSHGAGRTIGKMTNDMNPNALPQNQLSEQQKQQLIAGNKDQLYSQLAEMKKSIGMYGDYVDVELIDQVNGMVASAAGWYGEDVINQIGFSPGGNSEITVDTIGEQTGQSQPQTYTINQETGEVSGGDITPVGESGGSGTGWRRTPPKGKGKTYTANQPPEGAHWEYDEEGGRHMVSNETGKETTGEEMRELYGSGLPERPERVRAGEEGTGTEGGTSGGAQTGSVFGLPIQTGDNGLKYVEFGGQKYAADESNNALKSAMEAKGVSTTDTSGSSSGTTNNVGYEEALQQLENNPQFQALPESLKSLFRQTLNEFDFSQDVNIENIMKSFNDIKENTIDPRFSKEVESFTNQVQREYDSMQQERDMALEAERANAGQSIRQAKEGLEQSGMTFTGKGIEELGAQSAFAQDGSQIPSQQQTQGMFYEGNVNQANRLMSSSSALRYQKALDSLGQNAEDVLGGSSSLIPGYTSSGNLSGSMEDQKQTMYAQTLSNIAQQQRQKNSYNQPLDYNFPSYSFN